MKLTHGKDSFHDNIFYFRYEGLEGDSALINFGDGQETSIFPPRGQITHQYDKPGSYKVTVGKESVTVKAE